MRRSGSIIATACLVLLGLSVVESPSSSAAAPVRGRLVDYTTGDSVGGAFLRLRQLGSGGGPGAIVDTDYTDSAGKFVLDSSSSGAEEFYVELVAGAYQGGYVGGDPSYVQADAENGATFGAGASLGVVGAVPAFIRGQVVDSRTGRPVRKVRVSTRLEGRLGRALQSATSNANGRFNITGTQCEGDCVLRLDGHKTNHETGYRACNARVVATYGASCGSPVGEIGKVYLDRLSGRILARPHARATTRLVKPGRIGKARAGMTIKQAMATGEFNKDVANPPCGTIRLQPKGIWKRQYDVAVARGRIVQMSAFGARVRTAQDRGVGSTLRQLRTTYGDQLSPPRKVGYLQWGVFVHSAATGRARTWVGYLLGNAFTSEGKPKPNEKVTYLAVSKGQRPALMADGC